MVPTNTSSKSDLGAKNSMKDDADKFSLGVASSEQLVAGSIILASLCIANDHFGFLLEASYSILRFCKGDSMMVLTILHIFANLGGRKFFDLGNFGFPTMVLKSLVFLEGKSISVKSLLLGQAEPPNFGSLSDISKVGKLSNQEMVQCACGMNCEPCCLRKHTCSAQPGIPINSAICQLGDALSLLELIANKMP